MDISTRVSDATSAYIRALAQSAAPEDRECARNLELAIQYASGFVAPAAESSCPAEALADDSISRAGRAEAVAVVHDVVSECFAEATILFINELMRIAAADEDFDVREPHSVNRALHEVLGSGVAWNSSREVFGAATGWWVCRIAAALHHPTVLRHTRQSRGAHVSLPAAIFIGDVPEFRKLGLTIALRDFARHLSLAHASASCSWLFIQGGSVVFSSQSPPAAAGEGGLAAEVSDVDEAEEGDRAPKRRRRRIQRAASVGAFEHVIVPDRSLLVARPGVRIQIVSVMPCRAPREMGLITPAESAAMRRVVSGQAGDDERKVILHPRSGVRKTFRSVCQSGERGVGDRHPGLQRVLRPTVAIPVTLTPQEHMSSADEKLLRRLVEGVDWGRTTTSAVATGGEAGVHPRAREFDSTRRTETLCRLDSLIQAAASMLISK